jgi:uncharacterized membrane protein YbhN (UPF0104 family)
MAVSRPVSRNPAATWPPAMMDVMSDAPADSAHSVPRQVLADLRRIRARDVVVMVLIVGVVLLVTSHAGELSAVLEQMKGADWAWVAAAFVVGLATALTGGLAITGGFQTPLPYRPAVVLQTACWFVGLVAGSVGVAAAIVRFAQKRGLPASVALSAGVLVSVSGFAVQIGLLVVFLAVGSTTLHPSEAGSAGIPGWVLWLIAAVAVVIGAVLFLPRFRRWITDRVEAPAHDVWDNFRGIVRQPAKLARLLGGAAGTQVVLAVSLSMSLRAFGTELPFLTVITVNTITSFVNGLAPVPGGVGVAEAALYAGLTAAGVPSATAGAAAATYRLVTAYLPPLGGWVSLIWLRRHQYL